MELGDDGERLLRAGHVPVEEQQDLVSVGYPRRGVRRQHADRRGRRPAGGGGRYRRVHGEAMMNLVCNASPCGSRWPARPPGSRTARTRGRDVRRPVRHVVLGGDREPAEGTARRTPHGHRAAQRPRGRERSIQRGVDGDRRLRDRRLRQQRLETQELGVQLRVRERSGVEVDVIARTPRGGPRRPRCVEGWRAGNRRGDRSRRGRRAHWPSADRPAGSIRGSGSAPARTPWPTGRG